jgi:hypothetical protein
MATRARGSIVSILSALLLFSAVGVARADQAVWVHNVYGARALYTLAGIQNYALLGLRAESLSPPATKMIMDTLVPGATGSIHVQGNSSYCLDEPKPAQGNNAWVQLYACSGAANQKWKNVFWNAGKFYLVNQQDGRCLDYDESSGYPGKVQVYDCSYSQGKLNQQWMFNTSP